MANRIQYEAASEHILYLVLLPTQGSGEFSPFQGFSTNLYAALDAIRYICIQLPPTIGDLFRTRDEAIRYRSIGLAGHAIVPIEQSSLPTGDEGLPLTCFVSNSESREQVEALLAKARRSSWLHLTTDGNSGSIPKLWDFSRADFAAWTRTVAEAALAKKLPDGDITALPWRTFVPWPEEKLGLQARSHNITSPTETVLRSFNFLLSAADKPLAGNTDEEFAAAISAAADELERVRHAAGADRHVMPGSPTIIVAVPSVYRHLSAGEKSESWRSNPNRQRETGRATECLGFSFAQVSAQKPGREPGAPIHPKMENLQRTAPPARILLNPG